MYKTDGQQIKLVCFDIVYILKKKKQIQSLIN